MKNRRQFYGAIDERISFIIIHVIMPPSPSPRHRHWRCRPRGGIKRCCDSSVCLAVCQPKGTKKKASAAFIIMRVGPNCSMEEAIIKATTLAPYHHSRKDFAETLQVTRAVQIEHLSPSANFLYIFLYVEMAHSSAFCALFLQFYHSDYGLPFCP